MKLFLAYKGTSLYMDDSKLLACLEEAGKQGMTMMVHAENPDVLDKCRNDAAATGHYEPKYHYMTRPLRRGGSRLPCHPVCGCHALSHVHCPCQLHRGWRGDPQGSCGGQGGDRRDLSPLSGAGQAQDGPSGLAHRRPVDLLSALRDKEDQDYLWKALNEDWLSICGSDNSGIPRHRRTGAGTRSISAATSGWSLTVAPAPATA